MQADREARIRERAYQIWVAEGRTHGSQEAHWHRAEREIMAEEAAPAGTRPARARARATADATGSASKAKAKSAPTGKAKAAAAPAAPTGRSRSRVSAKPAG
jgi:hypothetical protein